jgi:type I restriction enzyme R subunit
VSPSSFAESVIEEVALAWLEGLGYAIKHGPEIAPGEHTIEAGDHTQSGVQNLRRDTLLPKLISGELRVPDAEPVVARHT